MEHSLKKELSIVEQMDRTALEFSEHLLNTYEPQQMRSIILTVESRVRENLSQKIESAEKSLEGAKIDLDDFTGANVKAS